MGYTYSYFITRVLLVNTYTYPIDNYIMRKFLEKPIPTYIHALRNLSLQSPTGKIYFDANEFLYVPYYRLFQ